MTEDLLTRAAPGVGVTAGLPDDVAAVVAEAAAGERRSADDAWAVRDLARLVDTLARRPELWRDAVLHRDGARWYTRLHLDADVEVWLLTWAQDTYTEMHDHGGSVGAYRVVDGVLTEDWVAPDGQVRRRRFEAGRTMAFGAEHVHDVINERTEPAVSIHAYSPPLHLMTYYAREADGVRPVRTEDVTNRVPA